MTSGYPPSWKNSSRKPSEYPEGTAVVVTTQHIHRTSVAPDVVRPRRLPRPNEAITEFMFDYLCYFQTSTFLCSRDLIARLPFARGLPSLQDVDWFLRVMREPGTKLMVVPEPLVIYHSPEGRKTITTGTKWKSVLEWGRANRRLMTRRAYSTVRGGVLCCTRCQRKRRYKRIRYAALRVHDKGIAYPKVDLPLVRVLPPEARIPHQASRPIYAQQRCRSHLGERRPGW